MAEHNLQAAAFPKLSEAQLAELAKCPHTKLRHFHDGEFLFQAGQRDYSFFIVKSGQVEIIDKTGDSPKSVIVHGPGQFTGEVAQLTGSPALVSGVARGECEVFEISPDALHQLLNRHLDLADIILQAFIARRQLLRESGEFMGLRVVGSRDSQDTFRVRDFLAKNRIPFTCLDLDSDPAVKQLLGQFQLGEKDTPVVSWGTEFVLRNPSNRQLANVLGLRRTLPKTLYDLVIVGGGPAGLAAAVYAASEGLRVAVLERVAPGGQAGRSMRIENYLGFPAGISGSELAERAVVQANRFGACLPVATQVVGLKFSNGQMILDVDGDESVSAKCLLIATGADYRLLSAEGCAQFEGCGVYYAATPLEAQMCRGSEVVVVGGGNSAGQAAVFLATQVRKIYLVIRGDNLYKDMSSYLAERVEQTANIEILLNSEVRRMYGEGHLNEIELFNNKTGETRRMKVPAVFSFIGAAPRTEWLPPEIEKDERGFVRTGPSLSQSSQWNSRRQPYLLETSHPGVFAAGDVRSGSVKRVASAVGEGSMVVQFVHAFLAEK
jgi:thioredoxin reductase (NADPH)